MVRTKDLTRQWERRANTDWAPVVLDLLVRPGRRTSVERAHGLRPRQVQWATILGDCVLEPHFERRRDAPHLSAIPNSRRATPTDRVIGGVVSTTRASLLYLTERRCSLGRRRVSSPYGAFLRSSRTSLSMAPTETLRDDYECRGRDWWRIKRSIAVDLQSGNAQSRDTMCLNRALPGDELFGRQIIAATSFFEVHDATVHRVDDRGLASRHPTFCLWRGKSTAMLSTCRKAPFFVGLPGIKFLAMTAASLLNAKRRRGAVSPSSLRSSMMVCAVDPRAARQPRRR
jgi:hypothetical protein